MTFLGYPRDPSWGPEDIILDTVAIWGWNCWGHWIQQPCFSALSYPKLEFRAKGTKVVGLPTCVAQLLPIWARAFSLNLRLKAVDATDLGSKGLYGIGGFPKKNMQNSAKNIAPSQFPWQKDKTGWSWETPLRGREMGFSWTVITFCRPNGFQIWDVRCDRGKILYKICENQPKIPLLTRFIGYRPKTVKKAGSSPGGQELGPRGPGWQVKTTS